VEVASLSKKYFANIKGRINTNTINRNLSFDIFFPIQKY